MTKQFKNVAKGVGIGMAIGSAVSIANAVMGPKKKNIKKTASKAVRTVGDIVDTVSYMLK